MLKLMESVFILPPGEHGQVVVWLMDSCSHFYNTWEVTLCPSICMPVHVWLLYLKYFLKRFLKLRGKVFASYLMIDIYTIIYATLGCSHWHLENFSVVTSQRDARPRFKTKRCLHKGFIILVRQFLSISQPLNCPWLEPRLFIYKVIKHPGKPSLINPQTSFSSQLLLQKSKLKSWNEFWSDSD